MIPSFAISLLVASALTASHLAMAQSGGSGGSGVGGGSGVSGGGGGGGGIKHINSQFCVV
jgi:hypothetical protein